MSKNKEGPLSRIWHSFRGGKDSTTEEALSQTGIDIIKTTTFEKRIIEFKEFSNYINETIQRKVESSDETKLILKRIDEDGKEIYEKFNVKWGDIEPEKKIDFMLERASGINERLHKIAIPWGTGGEQGWYADMSYGWAEIYTNTLAAISSVERLMQMDRATSKVKRTGPEGHKAWRPPIDKETLVEKLEYFFNTIYIQYAQKVADISWFGRDVVPTKVAMVQNIPQYGGGPTPYRSDIPFRGQPSRPEEQR